MAFELKLNPTVTGGTPVSLVLTNTSGTNMTYAFPSHTRLTPHTLSINVLGESQGTNATARTNFKIAVANRSESEGCCAVSSGTVIFDLSTRWPLSQPASVVDTAIDDLVALVTSTHFRDAVVNGLRPQL